MQSKTLSGILLLIKEVPKVSPFIKCSMVNSRLLVMHFKTGCFYLHEKGLTEVTHQSLNPPGCTTYNVLVGRVVGKGQCWTIGSRQKREIEETKSKLLDVDKINCFYYLIAQLMFL